MEEPIEGENPDAIITSLIVTCPMHGLQMQVPLNNVMIDPEIGKIFVACPLGPHPFFKPFDECRPEQLELVLGAKAAQEIEAALMMGLMDQCPHPQDD
jgi:hypothetical protein